MLKLDLTAVQPRSRRRRAITLTANAGEASPESMLGRRDFAVVPWLVVCVMAISIAGSEVWRNSQAVDWPLIGGALIMSVIAAVLAASQDSAIGLRYRRTLWVYVLGIGVTLVVLAAVAVHDRGVSTVYYACTLPLATYMALVLPRRWRPSGFGALFAITVAVQLLNPATPLQDTGLVWLLIVATWSAGLLGSTGHTRIASIVRALADFDRLTRSLNRRAFLLQLARAVDPATAIHGPVALLMIDLDGLRAHNEQDGEAAGDALLAWAGATFAGALPPQAELGRLGDDVFAVLLPATSRDEAEAVAHAVRAALRPRIDASVGVATSQTTDLAAEDVLRIASAACGVCKADALGVHMLVAGSTELSADASPAGDLPTRRPLSYAAFRATGKIPRRVEPDVLYIRMATAALAVVAAAGTLVVAMAWIEGGSGFAHDLVQYGGIAWVVWVLSLAIANHRFVAPESSPMSWFLLLSGAAALAIGLASSALADGGLTSPLAAAMFAKVLFDAATLRRPQVMVAFAISVCGWAFLAAFSPADTLWVVPFHLTLLASSFALGALGFRALTETGYRARTLAHTDDLTGLPNRQGFRAQSEATFFQAATETGEPFGVLAFRVHGVGSVNDRAGYAAGDALLRAFADGLVRETPWAYSIARTGGTEFMAAVPVGGPLEAEALGAQLQDALGGLARFTVGWATCPADGATAAALMRAADQCATGDQQSRRFATAV